MVAPTPRFTKRLFVRRILHKLDPGRIPARDQRSARRIAKLKFERASVVIIEELEAQLRILKAIYESATGLFSAGEQDRRPADRLPERQLGSWTFENVYSTSTSRRFASSPNGQDLRL